MAGLAIIINRAGDGEPLAPLHSLGLTDYASRYYVDKRTSPTVLRDRIAGDNLTAPSATGITVDTSGTYAHMVLSSGAQLEGTTVRSTKPKSFAALIRASGQTTKLRLAGHSLGIPASPYWQISLDTGGYVLNTLGPSATNWHLVMATLDGTSTKIWVNHTNTTTAPAGLPATPLTPSYSPTRISGASNAANPTEIRELVVWDRALVQADIETLRAGFKAHYNDLVF